MPTSWRNSKARLIVIFDLEEKNLAIDEKDMSAQDAWDQCYSLLPEFANVPFRQFEAHLKEHRTQLANRMENALSEERALDGDRLLHPRHTHNSRGEPVFDLSEAKQFLREDVANKLHTTMSSSELQQSRAEYRGFKRHKFKDRIHQEVRRQKFLHYLDLERSKKFARNFGESGRKRVSAPPTKEDALMPHA